MLLRSFLLLALGLFLNAGWLVAQTSGSRSQTLTWLKIMVVYNNGQPAHRQLRVQLLNSREGTLGEGYTNDLGRVEFSSVPSGSYHLRITGFGIVDTITPDFTIHSGTVTHLETAQVRTTETESQSTTTSSATVATANLAIPSNAQKEYMKGAEALREGKFAEARSRLEKAIALHPQYAAAYNDLGVVLMREGDRDRGRAAFEKAIELDPSYPRAYRNMAMLLIQGGKNQEASRLLEKSLALEPLDPQGLALLAHQQFITNQMEEAIATARRLHSVPHEGFAVAHFIAARALESRQLGEDAALEYRTFLEEAPNSPSAAMAREAIKRLTVKGR